MARMLRKEFIAKLSPFAIADMKKTAVPASLTIAQGILESADGNSGLTVQANNLFGIKGTGTAGSITLPTKEVIKGKTVTVQAKFRKYNSWAESVADHSNLFLMGVSWDRLKYHSVIGVDGITAARNVAKAGYATDPDYAEKLIKIIQDNNLLAYDNMGLSTKPIPTIPDTEDNRLEQLEEKVIAIVKELTSISDLMEKIEPPEWFIEEHPEALKLINDKLGTLEFWRGVGTALRVVKRDYINK